MLNELLLSTQTLCSSHRRYASDSASVPAIRIDLPFRSYFLSIKPAFKHALLKHMGRDRLQDVLIDARVPEGLQDLVLAKGFDCPSDFAFAFPTTADLQPFIVSAREFWTANSIDDPESSVAKALAECHRLQRRLPSPLPIPGRHVFSLTS